MSNSRDRSTRSGRCHHCHLYRTCMYVQYVGCIIILGMGFIVSSGCLVIVALVSCTSKRSNPSRNYDGAWMCYNTNDCVKPCTLYPLIKDMNIQGHLQQYVCMGDPIKETNASVSHIALSLYLPQPHYITPLPYSKSCQSRFPRWLYYSIFDNLKNWKNHSNTQKYHEAKRSNNVLHNSA